jgi:hypothetical protein
VLFSPAHELSATAEAMRPNMAAMQSARAGFAGFAAASTNARALATTGRLRGPGQAAHYRPQLDAAELLGRRFEGAAGELAALLGDPSAVTIPGDSGTPETAS